MATQFGFLTEYQPESDSVKAYLERVNLYFVANDVAAANQVPILLSSIAAATYALLCDLMAPDSPGTKSLEEVSAALRGHFEPKRSEIAERFHFYKRDQAPGESMAEFDAALRKLAMHCNFAETLEVSLRDRFVCGLRQEATQRRLLSEANLTYTKALDIAKGMEAAHANSKAFKTSEPVIKKMDSRPARKMVDTPACYRCGRTGHASADCKFKDAVCHACKKKGHIAPACRSKEKPRPDRHVHRRVKTHRIQNDSVPTDAASSGEEYFLHRLGGHSSDPIEVEVRANGKELSIEVDMGAALSIISESTRKLLFPEDTLHPSDLVLKTYTDDRIEVTGTLNLRVQYGEQEQKLVLVVVAGDGPSLLGRNWLKYLQLDWSSMASIRTVKWKSLNTLAETPSAFCGRVGHRAALQGHPASTTRCHTTLFQTETSSFRRQGGNRQGTRPT